PHLDGNYTIFGQVVEGQEIVEKIAQVPRDENDMPEKPVKIVRVGIRRLEPGADAPKPVK
ncbi:MAG: peptidylprolyl isomerase, partial [Bryobacteraceae bacterium]